MAECAEAHPAMKAKLIEEVTPPHLAKAPVGE